MSQTSSLSYADSGVVAAGKPLSGLLSWVNRTLAFRKGTGEPVLGIGYYANVLRIADNLGLAISTDSVGTKVLVAELMRKYDTLGIDCVAMNVNDVLCVGAEPLAMVDYLAVQEARPDVLEQIGKGLYEGARQANITIPGGELAQLREVIAGIRPEHFEDAALVDGDERDRGVTFQADIDVTEWLGNELYAYIPFEAPTEVTDRLRSLARELDSESLRTQLVASLDTASTIKSGGKAELWFDTSRMHLFDPASGENLTRDLLYATA